jgi:hypothetical protein
MEKSLSLPRNEASVHPTPIKGRGLACRKLSKTGKALLGAELKKGAVALTDLGVKQIASLVGVSPSYVHRALRLTPAQKEDVRRGLRPLVQPHAPTVMPPKQDVRERLDQIVSEIGLNNTLELLAASEMTNIVSPAPTAKKVA